MARLTVGELTPTSIAVSATLRFAFVRIRSHSSKAIEL